MSSAAVPPPPPLEVDDSIEGEAKDALDAAAASGILKRFAPPPAAAGSSASLPGAPTAATTAPVPAKAAKVPGVTSESAFAALRRRLVVSAAAIAEYVESNFIIITPGSSAPATGAADASGGAASTSTRIARLGISSEQRARNFALFLQAIGSLSESVYIALFDKYRNHVLVVLERLCERAKSSAEFGPFGMEFVIRAISHGVRSTAWSEGIPAAEPFAQASAATWQPLLTAAEMIDLVSERDPAAFLQRRIEMCQDGSQLVECFAAVGCESAEGYVKGVPLNERTSLLIKLLSKLRRTPLAEAENALVATAAIDAAYAVLCSGSKVFPAAKIKQLLVWAADRVPSEYVEKVRQLQQGSDAAPAAAVERMDVVMRIKMAANEAEFLAILDEETLVAGSGELLMTAADVVSSLAVKAQEMLPESAARARVIALLSKAQKEGCFMPRRAVEFLRVASVAAAKRRRNE